jgi:hypothetical protein
LRLVRAVMVGSVDAPGGPQSHGTGGSPFGLREYRPRKARLPGGTGCRDRRERERAERAHRGESQWRTTIDRMASIGSQEGLSAV